MIINVYTSVYSAHRNADATSYPVGIILLVAITVLLALLVLLMVQIQPFAGNREIPAIFTITAIQGVDEITGHLNYDSRLLLIHTGTADYPNRNLKAEIIKNGEPVSCSITTMNGHDFISTSHTGIQWMGGLGCSGETWSPNERISIDFSDGTFHPGDVVQFDVIDKVTNAIISRHAFRYE